MKIIIPKFRDNKCINDQVKAKIFYLTHCSEYERVYWINLPQIDIYLFTRLSLNLYKHSNFRFISLNFFTFHIRSEHGKFSTTFPSGVEIADFLSIQHVSPHIELFSGSLNPGILTCSCLATRCRSTFISGTINLFIFLKISTSSNALGLTRHTPFVVDFSIKKRLYALKIMSTIAFR